MSTGKVCLRKNIMRNCRSSRDCNSLSKYSVRLPTLPIQSQKTVNAIYIYIYIYIVELVSLSMENDKMIYSSLKEAQIRALLEEVKLLEKEQ